MASDANRQIEKWNARFSARAPTSRADPPPPLPGAVAGIPPGRALDLACGAGRHAVWLAKRGWSVVAVDGAETGVGLMLAEADRSGCRDRIDAHVADLEADPPMFTIGQDCYDLIVDCFFLHRPLFPAIRSGVRPGGMFVAALHLPSAGDNRGHGYVLAPGELERTVRGWGWRVLHTRERGVESCHDLGTAEIVAVRPRNESAGLPGSAGVVRSSALYD